MTSLTSKTAVKWAVGSWSLFIAENYLISEHRTDLIARLGDDNYHYFYGTCSTGAMASIVYAYLYKIRGVDTTVRNIQSISVYSRVGSFLFYSLALGMASQALPKLQIPIHYSSANTHAHEQIGVMDSPQTIVTDTVGKRWKVRCPFDFSDKYSQTASNATSTKHGDEGTLGDHITIRGLDRITRHPGLWSFAFLGLGKALLVPTLPSKVFFSMPTAVAFLGGYHTDSRFRRGMGGFLSPIMEEQTSLIPFYSFLTGKQGGLSNIIHKIWKEELKGLNVVLGISIAALLVMKRGR